MALQTQNSILIGGQEIQCIQNLKLHQEINKHQELSILCRMDVLESFGNELAGTTRNFLGETATIEINASEGFISSLYKKPLQFKGVVTEIKNVKGHDVGSGDSVLITVKSPSFLSDDGPHFASHNDVSLSEIITKTFEGYDTSKLTVDIRPQNDPTLHYSVQHNESAFQYASRLASQYGEWFYYDGIQLIFGEPDTESTPLTYGFDLKEYEVSLIPQSNNYKLFANDYLTDEIQEKSITEINAGLNGLGEFVSNKSKQIYTKETQIWCNLFNDPQVQQRLDAAAELQKKAIEIKQLKVSGICDNPSVKIGSIVTIEGVDYRITSVTHTSNNIGDYINNFEGVTADISVYPYTDINAYPKSETQVAIVKENADPEGLGRIKVQFPWQKATGGLTPWIRIVSPHAGGSKGFHFIPEIGEEVLVGFEGGNAEHPYVLGSLYTGKAKAEPWKSQNNDIKALQTRSGNKVVMNDKDGSITMADPSGNVIIMQGNGNIIISAPNTLTLSATDININAGNSVNIVSKPGENTSGEGIIDIKAKKNIGVTSLEDMIKLTAEKDFTVKSNTTKISMNAKTDTILEAEENTNINGKISLNINGDKVNVNGGSKIKIESTDTDIF